MVYDPVCWVASEILLGNPHIAGVSLIIKDNSGILVI
jgi:hypothetical protein